MMSDLAKMFLHCLNHWRLETPSARRAHTTPEESSAYKVNYTRWVCILCVYLLLPQYYIIKPKQIMNSSLTPVLISTDIA